MKKILCFGDSNTWGYIPKTAQRYDKNTRWTKILQYLLGSNFKIVEAGCCNRTCFMDNPDGIEQTGCKILPRYLNEAFDIIILALGINDIQTVFNPSLNDIKTGIEQLINTARKLSPESKIIVISPARLSNAVKTFKRQFDDDSIEKSKHFASVYEQTAKENNCFFFDWDKIVSVSELDGLHFSKDSHKKIAYALYGFCLEIMAEKPAETGK